MKTLRNFLKNLTPDADNAYELCQVFFNELVQTNQTMNLTTIIEPNEAEIKHFIDSLSAAEYVKGSVLDIGAGAGFPSLPLAIVKKESSFVLCDSVGKKVDFLNHVIMRTQLKNAIAIKSRAEDLDKNQLFDNVVMRGVGALNIICEYALPFLKIGGQLIAYKAKTALEELESSRTALKILGGEFDRVIPYTLTYEKEQYERNLVIIKKVRNTPEQYPRGQNKPRLKPL